MIQQMNYTECLIERSELNGQPILFQGTRGIKQYGEIIGKWISRSSGLILVNGEP